LYFFQFENCNSLFGTQGTVFGSKGFDYTDWVALPDDVAGYSSSWLAGDGFVLWNWTAKCLVHVISRQV